MIIRSWLLCLRLWSPNWQHQYRLSVNAESQAPSQKHRVSMGILFYWNVIAYNVVIGSAVQRSESAVCIHISPLSWTSCAAHPTLLGHHKVSIEHQKNLHIIYVVCVFCLWVLGILLLLLLLPEISCFVSSNSFVLNILGRCKCINFATDYLQNIFIISIFPAHIFF